MELIARIGLDATYSLDPQPSGMAVYSGKLIEGLVSLGSSHRFFAWYWLSLFGQRGRFVRPRRALCLRRASHAS